MGSKKRGALSAILKMFSSKKRTKRRSNRNKKRRTMRKFRMRGG